MSPEPSVVAEIATLLTRIQEATRVYPTQGESARRMTFATIRTAAETIGALADDEYPTAVADEVRTHVNAITASLDDLSDRFGSDEPNRCRVCAKPLVRVGLGRGEELAYCTHCPREMLSAVRAVSDATGAEVL